MRQRTSVLRGVCLLAIVIVVILISGATTAIAQTCVQPPPGMIAWWPFDETDGMTADDRVGEHPGAYAGDPAPAEGKVGGALQFDGNDYVAVADSDLWAFGSENFTVELWANFDAPGSGSIGHPGDIFIGNDEGPGTRRKWFFALGGGALNFHINGPGIGPQFFPRPAFSPIVGQWYHLAVTRSGSTYTIYVDGEPIGTTTNMFAIPNANAPLTIGQAENLGFVNGRLDEVTIYNRSLAGEEIRAIADAATAGKCKELQIRPQVGGNTGSVVLSVRGGSFTPGTQLQLEHDGEEPIVGDPVEILDNGTLILASFDLVDRNPGEWDIVIINSNGVTSRIRDAFTIEDGGQPQLWVRVVGPNLIRPGRAQTFHVFYGNTGNVDALGVPIWIGGIPKGSQPDFSNVNNRQILNMDDSVDWDTIPGYIETDNEIVAPILVPRVPAGQSGALSFDVTISDDVQSFEIEAWANAPIVSPNGALSENFVDCITGVFGLVGYVVPGAGCAIQIAKPLLEHIAGTLRTGQPGWWGQWIFDLLRKCIPGAGPLANFPVQMADFLRSMYNFTFRVKSPIDSCSAFFLETPPSTLRVQRVNSFDPNDKIGPVGTSDFQYVATDDPITYVVRFENVEGATAPAQEVHVTDQLDLEALDIDSVSLGQITFGERRIIPPTGASSFVADVDLRPQQDLVVRVEAGLNPNTGLLTWRLRSIDPATGGLPDDPLAGFLPPNINPPEGDGSVLFTVMPKEGLETGTEISNSATIIFDTNDPIETPAWVNTIDNDLPESHVLALDPIQDTESFVVEWEGEDVGAGVGDHTIWVSEDNGPATLWLRNTAETSATFTGEDGKLYDFYSVARDLAGNVEPEPETADATTVVRLSDEPDSDGDGIADPTDNCIDAANPDQRDTDGDGYGNLCDGDLNNDCSTNTLDLNIYKAAHRTCSGDTGYSEHADFDGNGCINTLDLNIYKSLHRNPPGPSLVGSCQ